jgi:predicted dehydrogenase
MAANAGKHVLVEKPMSLTVSEGLDMVRVCRDQGVKLGVGFHLRHHPGHIEAKRLVANGTLGTIALAQAQIGSGDRGKVSPEPRSGLRDWWTRPELVGGAFATITLGVHCIDDLHFILGQRVV